MDDAGDTYVVENFVLENGTVLPHAQLRYQTYGQLNERRDNVVVVCHALTGNASLHSWWGDLLGESSNSSTANSTGRTSSSSSSIAAFDTSRYFIVCCNILGSCYGSTNPRSINPHTGQVYGKDFPDISVRDTVRLQLLLLQHELRVSSIQCVVGGSFGGMQALEFAVQAGTTVTDDVPHPEQYFTATNYDETNTDDNDDGTPPPFLRSVLPIACGAQHTAWQIAISEVQRQAIYHDPAWSSDNPFGATRGLQVARQLGMISYRTPMGYRTKFGRHLQQPSSSSSASSDGAALYGSQAPWRVKSYLEYQGVKFLSRFDPVTYVKLTEQMDSHNVARSRTIQNHAADDETAALAEVLGRVHIPALILGIDSDVLYPLEEQKQLAQLLPQATLAVIHSDDGHDGFLLEQEQVGAHIADFLRRHG